MQERHFRGYKLYDDRTSFALEFGGFRGFNARAQGTLYKQAHAAAFDLMDRIEKLENVNVTKHPTESEDRPVDHYNLRMECEVKGRSLAKSIALWNTVKAFAKRCIDAKDYDHVIYNGIGGSYLGPYLLLTAKYGDDFNMALRARGMPTAHFVANTDPASFAQVIELVTEGAILSQGTRVVDAAKAAKKLERTLMVVISKSGGTAETATNCATYLTLLKDLRVPKPGHSFVAVTTEGSKLDKQANEQQFRETFHMNEATGGRTSVCSAVGMVPAAFAGVDFESFLIGMSEMDKLTRSHRENPMHNPAIAYATLLDWMLKDKSTPFNLILLAYSDPLKHLSHYCQQLFMESLGKNYTREALPLKTGLTILGGTGTGEQHAFMQQIQKGCSDAAVQMIRCRKRAADYPDEAAGSMGRQLLAFVKGTEMALYQNERAFVCITIDGFCERCIGQLIAFEERVVTILSAFWNINAFDQPGVQDGKLACLVCNKLSKDIEYCLAKSCSELKTCKGTAPELLKSLGVTTKAEVAGPYADEENEDITAWMADAVFEDIVTNCDTPGAYPSLAGRIACSKKWEGRTFTYSFAKK